MGVHRQKLLRRLLLLLPFFLLAAPRLQAQVRFGDVEVSVPESIWGGFHGYVEYRLQVSNTSPERGHRVRLSLPRNYNSFASGIPHLEEISRTVDLPPRSSLSVSLLQPGLPLQGDNYVGIWIDGQFQPEGIPIAIRHTPYFAFQPYAPVNLSVTASRQADEFVVLMQRAHDLAAGAKPSSGSRRTLNAKSINRSPFDLSEWSDSWLAYSSADGIVVSGQELAALSTEARGALFGYLEAGGFLAVLGDFQAPPHWEEAPSKLAGSNAYRASFGRCAVVQQDAYRRWEDSDWDAFFDSLEETSDYLRTPRVDDPSNSFPVAENLQIPVRGLFLFLIAFVIAVGPINVFLVSRIHKRVWLWWTVPAIALATAVGVGGYTLLSEGLRSHVRSESLTILDETRRRAASSGLLGIYSTLTPNQGLRFDRHTELTLLPVFDTISPLRLDWSEGQHLASGWIQARIPAYFVLRKAESRRERLPFRRLPDGSLLALNGLGAPVRQLTYQSPDGILYQARDIAPGEEKRLEAGSRGHPQETRIHLLEQFYTGRRPLQELFAKPQDYLKSGRYLAELQGSPFLESGLTSPKTSDQMAVVYGICQEAP